ncbi:hypothetical protein CLOBL_31130 [Clostridium sp. BL-8]|nr:hypothetical protein CLOBL_31130 [Clostridium sp. BL-8]
MNILMLNAVRKELIAIINITINIKFEYSRKIYFRISFENLVNSELLSLFIII